MSCPLEQWPEDIKSSIQFQLFLSLLLPVAVSGRSTDSATITNIAHIRKLELLLYGTCLSIFGLSIYVFRQKHAKESICLGMATTWIFFITRMDVLKVHSMIWCCHWNLSTGANEGENGLFFFIYVLSEIAVGIVLTALLASRLWWLNHQTEKSLGKSSQKCGLLLPIFLGVALVLNVETSSKFLGAGFDLEEVASGGPRILSICALTQVAYITAEDIDPLEYKQRQHSSECPANRKHGKELFSVGKMLKFEGAAIIQWITSDVK
ncbi:hypothetical protein BDP27DRAFT_1366863 [Rhodocollybia butyracea]|uniref:Uncharacterized protein n=1 Tax=Rhodocollybia butyracea TaxID=206335 RepID=A0A9P5U2P5_9AGAR|nr:hypothetical protein BDP27DRAFT_1366863 [Rhodocollybia butyracea]